MRLVRPTLLVDLNRAGLDAIAANGVAADRRDGPPGGARRTTSASHPLVRAGSAVRRPLRDAEPRHGRRLDRARRRRRRAPALPRRARRARRRRGPDGRREIAAADFFVTHFLTTLRPGELVVETVWPLAADGEASAFEELALRAGRLRAVDGRGRAPRVSGVDRRGAGAGRRRHRPADAPCPRSRRCSSGSSGTEAAARGGRARRAARRPPGLDRTPRPRYLRDLTGTLVDGGRSSGRRDRDRASPSTAASVREAVEPRLLLTDFLRHRLGLTGTHVGCEHGVCGACTVLARRRLGARLLPARRAGRRLRPSTTVESLAGDAPLTPLQEAFRRHHALQCGFCTPGILMAATDLLSRGRRRATRSSTCSPATSAAAPATRRSSTRSRMWSASGA